MYQALSQSSRGESGTGSVKGLGLRLAFSLFTTSCQSLLDWGLLEHSLCVCVCMHTCDVCVCMHTCNVCVCAYMRRVCVCVCMHTCNVCVCAYMRRVCVCVCACIHVTYICACIRYIAKKALRVDRNCSRVVRGVFDHDVIILALQFPSQWLTLFLRICAC